MTDVTSLVEGLVHEPTQTGQSGLDLTVDDVQTVTAPGRVDFGGGELEAAETAPHERTRRNADDDYQWWYLDAGQYLLEYNESLVDGARVRIQARDALREAGAFHPTVTVTSLDCMPVSVPDGGLGLKENARVSTVTAGLEGE